MLSIANHPKNNGLEKFICVGNKTQDNCCCFALNDKLQQRCKDGHVSILKCRGHSGSTWVTPNHSPENVIQMKLTAVYCI